MTNFFLSSTAILTYLAVQMASDIKTKKVYVMLNDAVILAVVLHYLAKCLTLSLTPNLNALAMGFLFLVVHRIFLRGVLGPGDAKALVVIFFQSGLLVDTSANFSLFYPMLVYLLASVFFSVYVIGDGVMKKKPAKAIFFGKEKHAFFPFLFPAYSLTVLIFSMTSPSNMGL